MEEVQDDARQARGALGQDLAWDEVDQDALVRFERYLRQVKENAPNTVRKELARLRRVYKQAARDGAIKVADDPFLLYVKPKGQRVERRKLTIDELNLLAELGAEKGLLPGTFDETARNAFVFAFYAGGMRFSDVCCLKTSCLAGERWTTG